MPEHVEGTERACADCTMNGAFCPKHREEYHYAEIQRLRAELDERPAPDGIFAEWYNRALVAESRICSLLTEREELREALRRAKWLLLWTMDNATDTPKIRERIGNYLSSRETTDSPTEQASNTAVATDSPEPPKGRTSE